MSDRAYCCWWTKPKRCRPHLLDELRVLTNLVRGGAPRVRLVLAGSSALEECFAHPELESFSQRLSARCYLGPFGREETIAVRSRPSRGLRRVAR